MGSIIYVNEFYKIITSVLYDYGLKINSNPINSIITSIPKDLDIFSAVNFIIKTDSKFPIPCQSIENGKFYLSNIRSSELREKQNESISKIFYHTKLPSLLYSTKNAIYFDNLDSQIFLNKFEDVYFYDSLILIDRKCCSIPCPDMMLNLTIRLHIPFFILKQVMDSKCKIIYKRPFVYDGKLMSETFGNKIVKNKTDVDNEIYKTSKNENALSLNTVYEVVINCTLSELKTIILSSYELEKSCDRPVLCYLYYILTQYRNIYNAIKINNDIKILDILWRNTKCTH